MKNYVLLLLYLLAFSFKVSAQDKTISGTITSQDDGSTLIGVSILLKGATLGTVTNMDGAYRIKVPQKGATLILKYIGYQPQEISVDGKTTLNIKMEPLSAMLTQVVVTGYGSQNRKTITSAITSVKSEDIANIPASSADQLLQGRASGVQVSSNSGTPGGGVSVRIRGTSSINASSDPLYVIDGIPVQSVSLSQLSIGGGVTNPMADINPADIESMEILKDASATAIYGARAANGVVLITTKRGSSKATRITLGMYYGSEKTPNMPAVVDGPTFETLTNEAKSNDYIANHNGSLVGFVPTYANPANAITNNWADHIFRTGITRNEDLSISGGSDKVQYLISANNYLQQGIVQNSDFNRSTGRVNLDFKPVTGLKMGTSILYSHNSRGRLRNDDNISGGLEGSYFYPPDHGVYNPDGSYYKIATFENPVAAINESTISMITNRFLGSIYAEYEFIPGLRLRSTFSLDYSNAAESVYDDSKTNAGSSVGGSAQQTSTNNNNWIQENVLSYQLRVSKNSFNTLLGTSIQQSTTDVTTANGTGFPSDSFREIVAAAVHNSSSSGTSYGLGSLFGRLNYDYDRKYLLTVNVRRDGSSRFGAANRWGTFPSVGLGWLASEESFLKSNPIISNLKLRGSYGITGNQSGITDFQAYGLWGGGAYSSTPGIAPLQFANPNLKWETTKQADLGLDLGLFKNRINVTVDYYHKLTEDLLLSVSIPRTTGFDNLVENYGKLQNDGLELGITADIIQNKSADGFNWRTNFNIAANRNKILKLAAPFTVYNRDLYIYQEGAQMYSFYLNPQTGVNPQTGAIQFEDVNHDGKFDANNDRKIVGTANPLFFGGITNNVSYKSFDLMFFFQYSYGNKELNWNRFFQEHGGTRSTNFSDSQLGRWQKPGDITMIPKMTAANYSSDLRPSRFLEDGSYMRLKNISLGYTLPASFVHKLKMVSARVYVSGQNLLTFTKYTGLDPELTGTASTTLTQGIEFYTMPNPKTILAGINVTF